MPKFHHYVIARGRAPHLVNHIDKDFGHSNLLFCLIQKVGYTNFWKFLNPVRILPSMALPERNFIARDRYKVVYDAIMHNSSWHKAVFYREPLERFLSGYLDKCIKENPGIYCIQVFGSKDATFDGAVQILIIQDSNKLDSHFHSQVNFYGELKDT